MASFNSFSKYVTALLNANDFDPDEIDKAARIRSHVCYMLNRTQSMFEWHGLPDTIPQRNLELMLQANGNVCFYKPDDNLYVFTGGLGGEPNVYYQPTIYTIANPALKISKSLKIDDECIVMRNDSLYIGLLPLFFRYASAITETEISIYLACVNSRVVDLISAPDDRTRESAQKFLDDLKIGKLGVIAENAFLDGVRAQPYGGTGNRIITELIELNQYQKASWFNDLGLNANYNMKRESINSGESQLNNDMLLPLVDDLLRQRREGAEKVNAMYGTEITVDLASAWKDNQQEIDAEQAAMKEGEPDVPAQTPENA